MKYRTIYADPPWMESGGGKCQRGADKYYSLMKTEDIVNMKSFIEEISERECHLYLWTANNFLPDALTVMKEWGFKYKTIITWFKDRIGLGQYFRGITEHCLFGIKGQLPFKIVNGHRIQGIAGFYEAKTLNSRKPMKMYEQIERVSYPPFIELFARVKREKWEHHGNQVKENYGLGLL